MDDNDYKHLADAVFSRIESAMDNADSDVVDWERSGDVVTLTLSPRVKCIVNTQRPTRQIWVAARDRAWHFSYDETAKRWLDDKDHSLELFSALHNVVKEHSGLDVSFE